MGNIVITSLLIFTFIFFITRCCSCERDSPNNNSTLIRCIPSERAALLNFKKNLTYFNKDVSSSWKGEECCKWSGVGCDETTGHVTGLDLSGNYTNHLLKMEKLDSLVYLLELRQLEILDLNFNNFSYGSIPILMGSMKQLSYLHFSNASLGGLVPYELGNLTNLQFLSLDNNMLLGEIPYELGNLTNLQSLSLEHNMLSGEIPASLGNLLNLEELILSSNQLSGKIPTSIGQLSKLQTLIIQYNSFEATVLSEPHFANLSSLTMLGMSDTMLTLNLSSDWVPPFQLQAFDASNCKINGQLPPWLQTQKNLTELDLSDANISGRLLEGLAHIMPNMAQLFLSNNQISGRIPSSLCQLTSLSYLDIKNNSLSGEIPNCLANLSRLTFVRLSYNKLKGDIPCFNNSESDHSTNGMGFYLHLNDNMFSGEIPSCLSDLSNLKYLDIGGNQFSGKMLKWFNAEKFRTLRILRLRGNKFSGTIPTQICSLPHLQLMDLGHNLFTGSIPRCLSDLTAMTSPNASQITSTYDAINEVIQGIERAYTSTLRYLVDIDLSCNNLIGSIPDDMTKIFGLLSLNLSYNQLSGTIPVNIGGLKSLVSLDLSNNKLRGSIPTSIGELYMLSRLNMSNNNLSGPIPTGNQLQTLSEQASIYAGNPYLCGDLLPKKCKSKVNEQDKGRSDKGKGNYKEKLEKMGFNLVVMSGFATGFWGVVGSLVVNRRWRHAVFRLFENGYDLLYVVVAVRVTKARRINRR